MPSIFNHSGKTYYLSDEGFLVSEGAFLGSFKGAKEAKEYLIGNDMSFAILDEIYEAEVVKEDIVMALQESEEYKVTEATVGLFEELVVTKAFFPDSVLLRIRMLESPEYYDKIDFVLRDGSEVLISSKTFEQLNNLKAIKENREFLLYMTESAENFTLCVEKLLGTINGN